MLMEFVLPPPVITFVGALVGTDLFSHQYHWEKNGIGAGAPPTQICKDVNVDEGVVKEGVGNFVEIKCEGAIRTTGGSDAFNTRTFYRCYRNGDVQVRCTVKPGSLRKDLKSLPRVGLQLALDPSLFNVGYLGMGEGENYPDRVSCSQMGVYRTTASQMHVPYIVPGECGAREGCNWVSFTDKNGAGVLIKPGEDESFSFSSSLYNTTELHTAMHTYDLAERKNGDAPVYVNISHKIMGVGGDCSWLPCVYDQYLVDPKKEYEFSFWICPLGAGQSDMLQSKRVVGV